MWASKHETVTADYDSYGTAAVVAGVGMSEAETMRMAGAGLSRSA